MPETNVTDFIDELGAGVFKEKLAYALSECAQGTIIHGKGSKKGKVTIELTLAQIGDQDQVMVSHKMSYTTPTKRGKKSEEDTTQTPMFVGRGGAMSVSPPREDLKGQFQLQHDADGKPPSTNH